MALKVGELYASFGIDSSGLNSAISGIEKKCSSIAKGLAVTGTAITASVTRSVVNLGKDIYNTGTEFHAQMSKVSAIAGSTEGELEQLTAKALEMGSTTSFTAKDAGEAMEYMAMAGWKTGEMLDGIGAIMNLAAASGENLGTTSDIVTDALTAFGLTAKDSTHFAEVMAATATNANTNVGMMGESFKYVAPLAGTLGYSIDDVAVALGVMANSGIKSSQAGTSLARILNNMIKPTEGMQVAMDTLGLSLYDSEGNTKSLMQVMEDMRAAAKGNGVDMEAVADSVAELDLQLENGEITERQYMDQMTALTGVSQDFMASVAELAGTRGLSGMLAIMNASDADFEKLVSAIANADGALDEMVGKMLDNAQGDMILFDSAVDGLKITLWDLVEGPFRGIVQAGTGVVQTIQGLDSGTQMAALKVAGLAAAAGPALTALGGLVGFAGKFGPILASLASPMAIVGAGLGLFAVAAVDADNSIGRMFKTVAGRGSAAMQKLNKRVDKSMKTVSDRMPALIDSITDGLDMLVPETADLGFSVINGFLKTISANASKLSGIGRTVITGIASSISKNAPTVIPNAVSAIANTATSVISNLPAYAHSAIEIGKSLIQGLKNVNWGELGLNLLNAIIEAVKGIGGELLQVGADIWDAIKSGIIVAGDWLADKIGFTPGGTWQEFGAAIWKAIKAGISATGDWIKGLIGYTPEDSWSQIGTDIWNTIVTGISATGDWIKGKIGYTPEASWGQIGADIWKAIKAGISATGDWIKGLIGYTPEASWGQIGADIWKTIKEGISDTGDWIKGLIGYTPEDSWGQIGTDIWNAIKNGISATGDWLKGKIGYTPDDSWGQIGKDIWTKILGAFGTVGSTLTNLFNNAAEGIRGVDWAKVGDDIWGGIQSAFAGLYGKFMTLFSEGKNGAETGVDWKALGQSILNMVASAFDGIGTLFSRIFSGATEGIKAIDWVDVGHQIWEFIKTGIGSLFGLFNTAFGEGKDGAEKVGWQALGESIVELVKAGLEGIGGAVIGIFDGIWLDLTNSDWFKKFEEIAVALGGLFVAAFNAAFGPIVQLFRSLGALISGQISIGEFIEAFQTPVSNGFQDIEDAWNKLKEALGAGEVDVTVDANLETEPELDRSRSVGGGRLGKDRTSQKGIEGIEKDASDAMENGIVDGAELGFTHVNALTAKMSENLHDIAAASMREALGEGDVTPVEINASKPLSDLTSAITTQVSDEMSSAMGQQMSELASAIDSGSGEVASACDNVVSEAKGAMTNSDGQGIGADFTKGISQGLLAEMDGVVSTAASVGSAVVSAIRKAWDEHSPSKVAKRIGRYFDIGLAVGLYDDAPTVAKAARSVADTVSGGFSIADPARGIRQSAKQQAAQREQQLTEVKETIRAMITGFSGENRQVVVAVELDGEKVGEATAPIVDRFLGQSASARR